MRFSEKTTIYGPTILTTTGIFATFVGIALGLNDFDTQNIQASVPALLGGLKTAFWASVVGVGGALTLKFRHYFGGNTLAYEAGTGADGDVTAEDLAKLLKGIQQALVGDDESTLVTQLKLTRTDTNDRLDALKKAQIEALQKLSEMGSKQLVEALRDVIKDFNEKITEQFGENFKQLNDGIGRMLLWQEQYRLHIEQTTQRQAEIVSAMKVASDSYTDLVGKAGVFTAISQQLASLLSALDGQRKELEGSLKALADLLSAASGSLPQIETKVIELTNQLTRSVTQNQQEVSAALAANAEIIKKSAEDATRTSRSALEEQQREVNSALAENVQLIRTSIQGVGQDFTKINQDFNKTLGETSEKIKQQVALLDQALAEELQKSLESLGRQLTALSEKFVADYTPLTDRLRAIVQIVKD